MMGLPLGGVMRGRTRDPRMAAGFVVGRLGYVEGRDSLTHPSPDSGGPVAAGRHAADRTVDLAADATGGV